MPAPIIEELRFAMRKRIFSAGVIEPAEFQAEGKNAPANADFYIRENITSLDAVADFQNSNLMELLVDYDIFADRKTYGSVTSKLYDTAEKIRAEFTFGEGKFIIALPELPNCRATLGRMVQYGSVSQEEDYFRLNVQIYVNVREAAWE